MQPRIPFHGGLFINAMIGFLGRQPDFKFYAGSDGHYSLAWNAADKDDEGKLLEARSTFRQWLDQFDVTFSACDIEVVEDEVYSFKTKKRARCKVLKVRINHPVPERKAS